jgi:thiamine-phosphate pyrophosphorylase
MVPRPVRGHSGKAAFRFDVMPVTLERRRRRLDEARLYFVCEARPHGREPAPVLRAALHNGAEVIQLRDKQLDDEALVEAASAFRAVADEHEALFILNDRPDLVEACGADGVHLGQEDMPPAEARRLLPANALLGLSTHSREQIEAAHELGDDGPDYLSVGPIWATPTKQGRPATGLQLIDPENVGEVVAAGARRIVVVRAIRDAEDPPRTARVLRDAVEAVEVG